MKLAAVTGRATQRLFAGVQALGDGMARHRRWISAVQWCVIAFYAITVSVPAFLPPPSNDASMLNNLTLFAQFLFWGVWWPGVILTTLFAGRVWCGVLCPEGALSEAVSHYSANKPIPRWVKWEGWKFVAFLSTTVWGQLVSVYEYPKPVLLILGGSTVAAVVAALLWGRNRRIWCRHLCPVNGVFGLLSRYSFWQFRVDRKAWDSVRAVRPVDCAPLVDIRRMTGTSACHMCGRCSGHRDAVAMVPRAFGDEIVATREEAPSAWEIRLLIFGMIGLAIGAFQWSASPWLITVKQLLAEWLIEHDSFWLLQDNAPWWLLTHYPAANDVFTWLDGGLILGYIGVATVLVGGWTWLWLKLAARTLPGQPLANFRAIACCLIPLAGVSLFLGLSSLSISQLKAEGLTLAWLPTVRGLFLAGGQIACMWTAWRWLRRHFADLYWARSGCVFGFFVVASLPVPLSWIEMFYVW